jgi:restriction system protein
MTPRKNLQQATSVIHATRRSAPLLRRLAELLHGLARAVRKKNEAAQETNMIKATQDGPLAVRPAIQWWSSLAVIAGAYLTCCLLLPPLISGDLSLTVSLTWLKEAAPLLGTACAAIATFAFFRRLDLRRLSETQNEIDEIRAMDWQHFELLVSDGFRRLGYSVDNRGWYVPNSPVHIMLQKNGEKTLVECRQWRAPQVELKVVDELYRVMTKERADGALLVTSGSFAPEAEVFARDKPIGLIDGEALLELVETARTERPKGPAGGETPRCPVCERHMVKKRAGKDSTIGPVYWGCLAHPQCLGTRPADEDPTLLCMRWRRDSLRTIH